MMRYKAFAIPMAAGLLALSGCGYSVFDAADDLSGMKSSDLDAGQSIGETPVDIAAFDELSVIGPDALVYEGGEGFSIRAAGSPDDLSKLRFLMKDGSLIVGRKSGSWTKGGQVTIYVTGTGLKTVSAAGSGPITVDRMSGPAVELSMAGSGSLKVASLETETLEATIAGSGAMQLAGKAVTGDISIAGSGDVDGTALIVDKADISIAGSGDVKLRSDGAVDASIMGSGDISVSGTATCNSSSMGSGKLRCSK